MINATEYFITFDTENEGTVHFSVFGLVDALHTAFHILVNQHDEQDNTLYEVVGEDEAIIIKFNNFSISVERTLESVQKFIEEWIECFHHDKEFKINIATQEMIDEIYQEHMNIKMKLENGEIPF